MRRRGGAGAGEEEETRQEMLLGGEILNFPPLDLQIKHDVTCLCV